MYELVASTGTEYRNGILEWPENVSLPHARTCTARGIAVPVRLSVNTYVSQSVGRKMSSLGEIETIAAVYCNVQNAHKRVV